MPSRHTCNQTTFTRKRHVERQAKEQYGVLGSGFIGENHAELLSYDSTPGVAAFTPGSEHLPCGTAQYNANPV
jgi:hypothetical protein